MALEQPISCFQWQNYCSDFLDGTLSESLKREADNHLSSCKECNERHKHFRLILSTIANQPNAKMPPHLRKTPFPSRLSRKGSPRLLPRWEHIPWYFRTILEGTGIVLIILLGITSAPKIRNLYEKNVDKNLSDFRENSALNASLDETTDAEIPTLPLQAAPKNLQGVAANDPNDIAGEAEEPEQSGQHLDDKDEKIDTQKTVTQKIPTKIAHSQLWRFTLKTVSPDELRPWVIHTLTELGIPADTAGLGGMQVPGGIEFDLALPDESIPKIKHALSKQTHRLSEQIDASTQGKENFSWYKVKSKRKLPTGLSQVVIWLAQPN